MMYGCCCGCCCGCCDCCFGVVSCRQYVVVNGGGSVGVGGVVVVDLRHYRYCG